MKYVLIAIVLAGIFLSAGCIGGEQSQPVATPVPTVVTTAPISTPSAPVVAKMAGKIYCYSGDYLGGCVGFNTSEMFYMETIEDFQGLVMPGGGTAVRYGTWETVSSDKVVVAYTYDMYKSFEGDYDGVTAWECMNSACGAIYETKYGTSMPYVEMTGELA